MPNGVKPDADDQYKWRLQVEKELAELRRTIAAIQKASK